MGQMYTMQLASPPLDEIAMGKYFDTFVQCNHYIM